MSQRFTTGSGDSDHTLDSVELDIFILPVSPSDLAITIREPSGDNPSNTVLYPLTNPSNLGTGTGTKTFTAPANSTLATGTDYFVHIEYSNTDAPNFNITPADAEDSGVADGWSIANERRNLINSTWTSLAAQKIKIAINTTATNAQTSGTISDLTEVTPSTYTCLLYTSPSPRDRTRSRMPSSA